MEVQGYQSHLGEEERVIIVTVIVIVMVIAIILVVIKLIVGIVIIAIKFQSLVLFDSGTHP